MRNLLSAEQVANRLGVQLKTVYVYVSRGLLQRTLTDDGRKSLFDPQQVEQLARRGRPRQGSRPVGSIDVSIATSITAIHSDRLLFRGHDVRTLCQQPFEHIAELLWSGERVEQVDWPTRGDARAVALGAALPRDSPATERFAVVAAAFACHTPLRIDLQPATVLRHARLLLASFVDCLPLVAARGKPKSSGRTPSGLALRLWPRLSALPASPTHVACLDTALCLLADHELATSTLAARVAASTRADPCSVVLCGLGAVSGPLHGKAALEAHQLLLDAQQLGAPERAVARTLAQRGRLVGFGHPVYRGVDPRAQCLLECVMPLAKRRERATVEAVLAAAAASVDHPPNVDFALAACAFLLHMPLGATEAVFAIARTAGWIAHALEEYTEPPLRFRARALYVGALSQ
jgi:citrate synthase